MNAALLDIGAGDIQLDGRDALGVRQDPRDLGVFVNGRSAHVDDDGGATRAKLRQFFRDESMNANALKPDRIQHAGGRFDDARRRVTFAFAEEETFDGDGAE